MAKTLVLMVLLAPALAIADIRSEETISTEAIGGLMNDSETKDACEAAKAARLSLASSYGSCEAPAAAKGGGVPADTNCQSMPSSNPGTLAQVAAKPSQCPKRCGKPKYDQKSGRLKVNGDTIDPIPGCGTDCSGFVSGVWAKLGRRFEVGKDIKEAVTTKALVDLVGKPNSCLVEVTGEIHEGDMVVHNDGSGAKSANGNEVSGHVYLIDRISSGGPGSCEFSIIESGGGNDASYGGPRVVVKGGEKGGSAVSDRKGRAMKGMSKDCVAKDGKGNMKVARFDKKKAGCQGKKKKFVGEDCVKSCPNLGVGEA